MSDVVPRHTMVAGSSEESYKSTVAEWALFTSCNKFIITDSGFSKTSVMYSLTMHSTWMLPRLPFGPPDYPVYDVFPPFDCLVEAPADVKSIGFSWSGI